MSMSELLEKKSEKKDVAYYETEIKIETLASVSVEKVLELLKTPGVRGISLIFAKPVEFHSSSGRKYYIPKEIVISLLDRTSDIRNRNIPYKEMKKILEEYDKEFFDKLKNGLGYLSKSLVFIGKDFNYSYPSQPF